MYPDGSERWNFIRQYNLDEALDTALEYLTKKPVVEPLAAERSFTDNALSLIKTAKSIAIAANGLLRDSASQSIIVAANCLATAAISLADTAQHLVKSSAREVEDAEKTLVFDAEEFGGDDMLADAKDKGEIKMEE